MDAAWVDVLLSEGRKSIEGVLAIVFFYEAFVADGDFKMLGKVLLCGRHVK